MASFLNVDLPSEDEEDDDYRPEVDKTAEAEDRKEFLAGDKRVREEEKLTVEEENELILGERYDPSAGRKRAKIEHLWELLNSKSNGSLKPNGASISQLAALRKPAASTSGDDKHPSNEQGNQPAPGPSNTINLASLCRTVDAKERKTINSDKLWMRMVGLSPKQQLEAQGKTKPETTDKAAATDGSQAHAAKDADGATDANKIQPADFMFLRGNVAITEQKEVNADLKAMAAFALQAAKEGSSFGAVRAANKVTIMETRRFAGKDIQVAVQVDKNSKEAAKAAEKASQPPAPKSGLDAFLDEVTKKKKVNVLDKTKADWNQLKAKDATLEEELEAHKRSGGQYLDKVDFLKRSELREYEKERDQRLASDVRTRGRL